MPSVLVGRRITFGLFAFFCLVVADQAARHSAHFSMMTCVVARNTAHNCSFDATLGVCGSGRGQSYQSDCRQSQQICHGCLQSDHYRRHNDSV